MLFTPFLGKYSVSLHELLTMDEERPHWLEYPLPRNYIF